MLRRRLLPLALLALLALLFLADLRHHPEGPPRVVAAGAGLGGLEEGVGAAPIAVPFPVPRAGYGPRDRTTATTQATPLQARSLALQVGGARLTLASVDLLLIDSALPGELAARLGGLGGEVWICATHTHSGPGGYDPNLLAQLAGTGRYQRQAREAVLAALEQAVRQSWEHPEPALLGYGRSRLSEFIRNRSDPRADADAELDWLEFVKARGPGQVDVDVALRVAAHPTLAGREEAALDGDYPAALLARPALERSSPGHFVPRALFQGSVGDATIERERASTPAAFAQAIADRFAAGEADLLVEPPYRLATARVEVPLPAVDFAAAPRWAARAAGNLGSPLAPRNASLAVARLGGLTLLAVPGEPTYAAGEALLEPLRRQARAQEVVTLLSLCNGYVGYVETPDRVTHRMGEAERTYFGPGLLETLQAGAELAAQAASRAPLFPPP